MIYRIIPDNFIHDAYVGDFNYYEDAKEAATVLARKHCCNIKIFKLVCEATHTVSCSEVDCGKD